MMPFSHHFSSAIPEGEADAARLAIAAPGRGVAFVGSANSHAVAMGVATIFLLMSATMGLMAEFPAPPQITGALGLRGALDATAH